MRKINKYKALDFFAMKEYLKDKTADNLEKQNNENKEVLFFLFVPSKKKKLEVN